MSDKRLRFARFTFVIILGACLATSCGNNKGKIRERPIYTKTATTVMPLNHPLIETLGQLEGPYRFISADAPFVVQLIGPDSKIEPFIVLGLRADEYPPAQDPSDAESQAVRDAEIEDRPQLYAFKQKALADLFGDAPVWVLRMNSQLPSIVYIFKPENPPLDDTERPVGPGQLINAEALRRSVATMELDGVVHPFYEMMLDAQLAAIVEARRQPENADLIWNTFHLRVPEDLETSIKKMESKL